MWPGGNSAAAMVVTTKKCPRLPGAFQNPPLLASSEQREKQKRPRWDSNPRITDLQSVSTTQQDSSLPQVTPPTDSRLSPDLSLAAEKHPELTELIRSWSALPAAVRAGIMATSNATNSGR
jgi:hypothetical protein